MVGVVSSIPTGGNFVFCWNFEAPFSVLYKNTRNVRFVLFTKNLNGFFTNSQQYKNSNIANFVLDLPLEMNKTNEDRNLEMQLFYASFRKMKKNANKWEHNGNIAILC